MRQLLRILVALLATVALAAVAGVLYARSHLRASLPLTSGAVPLAGLSERVTIERDGLGVPRVRGLAREDVARALGFLHAQERFFQMDLQRRRAAGELSALVGVRAAELDVAQRVHRFRAVAREAYVRTSPSWRQLLDAYAAGVNAGLAALGSPPFEYALLRATPEPWVPEDSLLTVLAMFVTLQDDQEAFEAAMGTLHDALPAPAFRFLAAAGSAWDTPVEGSALPRPPIPGPDALDLRTARLQTSVLSRPPSVSTDGDVALGFLDHVSLDPDAATGVGSNSWAVDAARAANGRALLANDMHLQFGLPNIWYRAELVFPDPTRLGGTRRLVGVTLPGLPTVVVGSNGDVAWGFTNTQGDWSDLVRIEPDPSDSGRYLTPAGPLTLETTTEQVAIAGGAARPATVRSTMWGPVVRKDVRGVEYAQRWVAHDASILAADPTVIEHATSVDAMATAFAGLGMPQQNVVMADSRGRIAWTIGGAIPRRVGFDGLFPTSWADGTRRWDGYLSAAEFPRIVDPPSGRIWTANAPVVDGARLATVGDSGYADGIRAHLIRDRLMSLAGATPRDMLAIQLDDRALFLERWRALLLDLLADDQSVARAEFRRLVETAWTGRAEPASVGYRLVRAFRTMVVRDIVGAINARLRGVDPSFDYAATRRVEGPVWEIITARAPHLLNPTYASWREQLLGAVDAAIADLTSGGTALASRSWGEFNRGQIAHPLAAGVPFFGRFLAMPHDALPGDVSTPRASTPRTGPSERLVVSPGHEEDGILHMPGGQSGHPLSPHYGDQHAAWVSGMPTPLLTGAVVSTLTLVPNAGR